MLIVGAKGFAKEVLQALLSLGTLAADIALYEDGPGPTQLHGYPILRTPAAAQDHFTQTNAAFTLGVGGPALRRQLWQRFVALGGEPTTVVAANAMLASLGTTLGAGCNVQMASILEVDVVLQQGVLINMQCTIGHDSHVGAFSELCPGVRLSGGCNLGAECYLGTGAIVLPGITLGQGAVVGAGAVVTQPVPAGATVVGVPARLIKQRT